MRDFTQERQDIDAAVAGWTLPKAFAAATVRFPDVRVLESRGDAGWEGLTFAQYREVVRDLTLGLARQGFAPGEAGLILAGNVPEHVIADLALVHARGASVSLYTTLAPDPDRLDRQPLRRHNRPRRRRGAAGDDAPRQTQGTNAARRSADAGTADS